MRCMEIVDRSTLAVLDDVFLSLHAKSSGLSSSRFGSQAHEVVERNRLGGNEPALEIAVDHAGCRRGLVTRMNGPRPCFLGTRRQEGPKTKQMVDGSDKLAHSAVGHAEVGKELASLERRQFGKFALDLGADDDRLYAGILGPERFRVLRVGIGTNDTNILTIASRQFLFPDVAGKNSRLGSQQKEPLQQASIVIGKSGCQGGLPGIQMGKNLFAETQFSLGKLVAIASALLEALGPFFDRRQVRQDQLGGDHLDVSHGVN